jgi:hypothetical protein
MSHGYKQNEISQELSMETKIFKTSYYTVLRAFSAIFKAKHSRISHDHVHVVPIPTNNGFKPVLLIFLCTRFDHKVVTDRGRLLLEGSFSDKLTYLTHSAKNKTHSCVRFNTRLLSCVDLVTNLSIFERKFPMTISPNFSCVYTACRPRTYRVV